MSHSTQIVLHCNKCGATAAHDAPFGSNPEALRRVREEAAQQGWTYTVNHAVGRGLDLCPTCTQARKGGGRQ